VLEFGEVKRLFSTLLEMVIAFEICCNCDICEFFETVKSKFFD
jgi:hypothetical protein